MPRTEYYSTLQNYARGETNYRHARHRIYQSARLGSSSDDEIIHPFLRDKLFKLQKEQWFALAFDDRDWKSLDQIAADKTGIFDRRYLQLALNFIQANASRVQTLNDKQLKVGRAILYDEVDVFNDVITSLDDIDRQSLFIFRTIATHYSFGSEELERYFRQELKTDWLHKRFLYPLIYHAINNPREGHLDNFLSYVVTGQEREVEKSVIKILLRDDVARRESLGFKAYVSLLCHPYDTYEMMLNHIELELSTNYQLPSYLLEALCTIANTVPTSRATTFFEIAMGAGPKFSPQPVSKSLTAIHGFDASLARLLNDFVSVADNRQRENDHGLAKPLATLVRLRARKYPIPEDFDYLTARARGWWFCQAGRLLNALITSLYMIPRRDRVYEVRDLIRLTSFFGDVLPFFLASPSGSVLLQKNTADLRGGDQAANIEAEADLQIEAATAYDDRMWIKAVQWELRDAERRMQISRWLETVRQQIRIAPAFLTGIDWRWLDTIIRQLRLRPFIGNSSGLYALLLQKVEERDRRSEALRVATEPFVSGKSLEEFIEWLISEYKQEAVAFVRYFLDTDNLLLLGLAPNLTAAIAARIYALQRCIRQFGYTDLLTQNLFAQEWATLNSSLLLMSVNAGQFEIPWGTFERDTAAKQHDLYTTAHTLQPPSEMSPLLSEAKITNPYRYRNEKTVIYTYPNKFSPMVALVIGIVEDFLEHPGFGLEVVLSTRFRHDTMRREFANVILGVAESSIPSVLTSQKQAIIEEVEPSLLKEVDTWLNEFMHTSRPEKPSGLLDIIPSQEELKVLLEELTARNSLEEIISEVTAWIRSRLEQQLPNARARFAGDVAAFLASRVTTERERLLDDEQFRPGDIDRVMSALSTALQRRVEELCEWFRSEPDQARPPLTFHDLKMAADGLFEGYKNRRKYKSYLGNGEAANRTVEANHVRLCFDLLREVFASAIAHTAPGSARIRLTPIEDKGDIGFRFSNLCRCPEASDQTVAGHPYTSLNDVIFREGESGLAKIASMSASILGHPAAVVVRKRERSFHLDVLFWQAGGCDG